MMEGREKQIRALVMQDVWDWYEPIRADLKLLLLTIDTLREENQRLREAAELRLKQRHSFNCQSRVIYYDGPCTCGHDALAQAVKKKGE